MTREKPSARTRILAAADDLAREVGPGHISLEAVAARAGISKGGLLYHFPSKEKLLEAVVEEHLQAFDELLSARERENDGAPDSVTRAFLDLFLREHERKHPPPAGLMMALAENPGLMRPVRRFHRMFLDRMKKNATDPDLAVLVFLALHGMRNMQLLNMDVVCPEEFETLIERLKSMSSPTGE